MKGPSEPCPLSDSQIADYRRDGFLRVPDVLESSALTELRTRCLSLVRSLDGAARRARFFSDYTDEQRQAFAQALATAGSENSTAQSDTYRAAFTQVTNLWRFDAQIEALVRSPELGAMAAALLGADGVRVYHDQALIKEAGGGHTPWHVDQFYWPIAGERTLTLWIPLQAVSADMGPLAFAPGSQHMAQKGIAGQLAIGDESEARLAQLLDGAPLIDMPFSAGEVSFHNGWTCHRAGPNRTDSIRAAFTIIYMASDARMISPRHHNHQLDAALWLPGVVPGAIAASALNPLVFGR
jgi:ectoine hydroxylase-related dioxygenase (phytanoyl-CoA dioxygenase family)